MRGAGAALLVIVTLLLASCSAATEIIVVVDTDFAVPEALDTIDIIVDASGLGGQLEERTAPLDGEMAVPLPVSLGVVRTTGPLEPLLISAIGRLGAEEIVRRDVRVTFVAGEIRVLRIMLDRRCFGVVCAEGLTCAAGSAGAECRSIDVGAAELDSFDGEIADRDGGFCEPTGETCNARDDDCDGAIDEVFDFEEDSANCGSCGAICPATAPNAVRGQCITGTCELLCDDGYFDCDADPANGCESDLLDLDNCGACGASCRLAGAMSLCDDGVCTLVACDAGFRDCDMVPENGCESQLVEVSNCGGCGVRCALPNANAACGTGTCEIVGCMPGFDDCDGSSVNGCEVSLSTSLGHCGACGNTCPADPPNASATCDMGSCGIACDPGFEDCDGLAANGCEASLDDPATCGDCTTTCPVSRPRCSGSPSAGFACVLDCPGVEVTCGDTCADLTTSVTHCGMCGNACAARPNTTPSCSASRCVSVCDSGWGDCTGGPSDGCERRLDTLTDCGTCGNSCSATGADILSCTSGACTIETCMPGRDDCDGSFANGCETSLTSLPNCGTCGSACSRVNASASCASGTCLIDTCNSGFRNCDGSDGNGCEADLGDPSHCGTCSNTCPGRPNATATCTGGACGFTCLGSFRDCDGDPVSGCETNTTTSASHCGGCGMACTPGSRVNGVTCSAGSCEITSCSSDFADCNGLFVDGCEVDTDRDDDNCGVCGRRCTGGSECDNGVCD